MKIARKLLAGILSLCLVTLTLPALASCGKQPEMTIRYLNFKPEIAEKYKKLAKIYEKETGVRVIIDTAASGTYEETLAARMGTSQAPALFQINGPKGYASWKDYCADLSEIELTEHLLDENLAVRDADGKVVGLPYVVEGYGIIYNKAITDRYFALPTREVRVTSMDDVTDFATLSALVTDMQAHKADLGIDGVFASTSLKTGEDWRWQTHLANIPIYYEFLDRNVDLSSDDTKTVDFRYSDNYKRIFDLYTDNSTVAKGTLGTRTVTDSMAEFALGKCAMVQNGNWAWEQIKDIRGNKVEADNIRFLPIYTGIRGESSQGLCVGTENYYAINKKAPEEQQKAAADFIWWLNSSEIGKQYVTKEFGFIAPFDTYEADEVPDDPLAKEVLRYTAMDRIEAVPWIFTVFPSAAFKEHFGASLLRYAQGTKSFDAVVTDFIADWKRESGE